MLRTALALCAIVLSMQCALAPPLCHADAGPLRVVVTTPELAALTRAVGGDDVSLTVLVKGTEDPHFAEAKSSFVRAINEADLFVQMGLELEMGYAPLLLQQGRNPRVLPGSPGFLDASSAIGPPVS